MSLPYYLSDTFCQFSTRDDTILQLAMSTAATPKKKVAATKPKKASSHPKYTEMIATSIESLKERGGSSRQAILKYISSHYDVGKDERVVNQHLKMALRVGVKSGSLKHRRVGKFPTRRKGEAGHSCYQEAVGGEEKSEEGGEEGDQKPKESGCKKPQEGGEEDREAEGSFKAEGSSKAEKDAGQSEEIECKQAEEGSTCEKSRQEGIDSVCRCAGVRPPSNGSFQSQPPHLGETRSSLGLTVFRAIIATARVLPKATQRELFRLGAWLR